jgi:hypothetical protein
MPDFIFHDHIRVGSLYPFSFLSSRIFALGIKKCSGKLRQIPTMRNFFDPVPSAYCEEISRHRTPPHPHDAAVANAFQPGEAHACRAC